MEEQNRLVERFEEHRAHLNKVAFRMLGSESEADDAVQEAWLRLSRSDAGSIDNLAGWLTTVVSRICLDMLRSRKARREEPLEPDGSAEISDAGVGDPEREAILADTIEPALLAVLHPECEFRPDDFAQLIGAPKPIKGAKNVADFFNGGAADARRATIDGAAGAAWAPGGKLRAAISFSFRDDRIVEIEVIADRKQLQELEVELLDS